MKIIIVGGGKTGSALAHSLSGENHDVTVIEKRADKLQELCDDNDIMGIVGSGLDNDALSQAGIESADLLIAVTAGDEDNLLCCLFAKKNAECDTIARVRNPLYVAETDFIKQSVGLSMIINPEYESAKSIARIVRVPSVVEMNTFFDGMMDMLTFKVGAGSILDGQNLSYVRNNIEQDVLFCTVQRNGESIIPSGDFTLAGGDKASIIINPAKATEFFTKIGVSQKPIRSVMIAGGGTTGFYVAKQLIEMGINVCVVEIDEDRCNELAELLPKALIIHGDASDKQILAEEGVYDYDAFVALTGFDEENIMLSLSVKDLTGNKVITKIDRVAFTDLIAKLNLDSVVYPYVLTDEYILQYVRAKNNTKGSNVEKIYKLIGDEVEALEFKIGEKSRIIGKPLRRLKFKPNVIICGILHRGKFIIPDGNSVLHPGDRMVVVTGQKNLNDVGDILN